jgi:hypothetical protein
LEFSLSYIFIRSLIITFHSSGGISTPPCRWQTWWSRKNVPVSLTHIRWINRTANTPWRSHNPARLVCHRTRRRSCSQWS